MSVIGLPFLLIFLVLILTDSDTCIFLMSWSDYQRVEKVRLHNVRLAYRSEFVLRMIWWFLYVMFMVHADYPISWQFQVPHWMHPSCSIWSLELILRSGHATLNVDGLKDGYMETRPQPCASFYAYLPAVKLLSLYSLYFIYEATGCLSPVWHLHIPVLYVPFHNGSLQSCNDNFDVYLLRAVLREITLGSVQCPHSPLCGDCTVLDGVSGIVTLGKELMLVLLREVLEMAVGVVACFYYFNRLPLHGVVLLVLSWFASCSDGCFVPIPFCLGGSILCNFSFLC